MRQLLRADLTVDYPDRKNVLKSVSIEVGEGEIVGVVGESGSGKSTLALALLRLLTSRRGETKGRIFFDERDLLQCSESEMRAVRGRQIALALQSASTALNPVLRIGDQLRHCWKAHEKAAPTKHQLSALMRSVELPQEEGFLRRLPNQLSVGQAQRLVIGMAIMHRPKLLIVDEPTSALDLLNQAKILKLFRTLNRDHGVAIVYISHDLFLSPLYAIACM